MIITAYDVKILSQIAYDDLGFNTDGDYETFLEADIIPIATKIIEDYCGVPSGFFDAGGVTIADEYYDSDGSGHLWLKYRPILSVTAVAYNEKGLTEAPSWVSLAEGPGVNKHYLVYAERGLIFIYDKVPPEGKKNIKITYKAGYSSTPVSVAEIAKQLSANMLRGMLKRKITPQEISQLVIQGGDVGAIFAEDLKLSREMMRIVAVYRLPVVSSR